VPGRNGIVLTCPTCGGPVYSTTRAPRLYCSIECYWAYLRSNAPERVLNRTGYILVFPPSDAFPGCRFTSGRVFEHQVVWWNHYGYLYSKTTVIHHINGDKADNRIENLVCMSNKLHLDMHHDLVFEERRIARLKPCAWCSDPFLPNPPKRKYCSQACYGKSVSVRYAELRACNEAS
jgi:hypothetical protein